MANPTNITTAFAQQLIQEVLRGCARLAPGTIRKVKTLCDRGYWHRLTAAQQKLAGKIIAEAVKQGLLPLVHRCLSPSHHLLYKRV
jgi:hypothetical protein